jgi:nucleotide-binding universal stress UspA family protein
MKLRRIFHPTDFSPSADVALRFAIETASRFDAELLVGHVDQTAGADSNRKSDLEHRIRKAIARGTSTVNAKNADALQTSHHVIADQTPGDGILRFAREHEVDAIVIARHGVRPIRRLLLGSVALGVLHAARTDVVVVPDSYDERRVGRILVPLDLRDRSSHIVRVAASLSRAFSASVDLLHVIDLPERLPLRPETSAEYGPLEDVALKRLKAFADELGGGDEDADADAEVEMSTHVETGHPVGAILAYADQHEVRLLALASSGMSPDERIRNYPMEGEIYDELHWKVSRVTERLATYSDIPVWVIKRFPTKLRRSRSEIAVQDPSVLDM